MQQYMTDLVAFDDKLAKRTKGAIIKLIDLYNQIISTLIQE